MSYPNRIGPTQYDLGPRVDLFEASVRKACAAVKVGDRVAVSWSSYHVVTELRKPLPEATDTRWRVELTDDRGRNPYTVLVRGLNVVQS